MATPTPSFNPTPTAAGCQAINGEILTYNDQQYLVLCNTDYEGGNIIGLDEPSFRACVHECAIVNEGFSFASCQGVTFFPNATGADCYLKTPAAVEAPTNDTAAIGAVLFNSSFQLNATNVTTSVVPSTEPTASSFSGSYSFSLALVSNFKISAVSTGSRSIQANRTSISTTSFTAALST